MIYSVNDFIIVEVDAFIFFFKFFYSLTNYDIVVYNAAYAYVTLVITSFYVMFDFNILISSIFSFFFLPSVVIDSS